MVGSTPTHATFVLINGFNVFRASLRPRIRHPMARGEYGERNQHIYAGLM